MFYIQQDEKIILFDEDLQKLQNTLLFMPEYSNVEILETDRNIIMLNEEFVFEDEHLQELQDRANQERNAEIDSKIKELQIMALPEVLNGNIENIKLYNEVIDGLEKARP